MRRRPRRLIGVLEACSQVPITVREPVEARTAGARRRCPLVSSAASSFGHTWPDFVANGRPD